MSAAGEAPSRARRGSTSPAHSRALTHRPRPTKTSPGQRFGAPRCHTAHENGQTTPRLLAGPRGLHYLVRPDVSGRLLIMPLEARGRLGPPIALSPPNGGFAQVAVDQADDGIAAWNLFGRRTDLLEARHLVLRQ